MKSLTQSDSNDSWSSTSTKNKEPIVRELSVKESPERKEVVSVRKCARLHAKAIGWSVLLSTVVIMESFDVVVTTGFFALPAFKDQFGDPTTREVPPAIKAAIVNAVLVGEIVGLTICGWAAERLGFRWTLSLSLIAVSVFLFLLFFATSQAEFIAGQFLCGIPLGVFQTLPATYASDILPSELKPYLTTYVNFCWAFGGLVGSGVQRGVYRLPKNWAWRLPIALQWVWPIPLITGILLAPESPYHLIRHSTPAHTFRTLSRLTPNPDHTLESIAATNAIESRLNTGTRYRDIFRPEHRRRTEATIAVWSIQMLSGSMLMYFSTVFFLKAGLNEAHSFTLTPVMYGVGCLGTIASWGLIHRIGRRTIYLYGTIILGVCMFGIATAGSFPDSAIARWISAAVMVLSTLVYDTSIGPVCYCLVTELPSSRMKVKTVSVARCAYLGWSVIMNVIVPYMLTDWGARCGFLFGGLCVLSVIWIYFRLPETKDKSVEEMDAVFTPLREGHGH